MRLLALTEYTLTLTETDKGVADHGRHLGRRAIARQRVKGLGYKIKKVTPGDGKVRGVYQWIVDDQSDVTLDPSQDLKVIFEYYGYVKVTVA
jgi:hypothetical protein